MKYFLFVTVGFLLFCFLFGYFYDGRPPQIFYDKLAKQKNPFVVPKDSTSIVWQRAKDFLELRKYMIVGGNLQMNDTVIFLPYYNDYHKGNSLRIEKHRMMDSTLFKVTWWYSGDSTRRGAYEIAMYMQYGIDKYQLHRPTKRN